MNEEPAVCVSFGLRAAEKVCTELGDKLSSISGWKQLFKSSKTQEGERLAQHELSEH